MSEEPVSRRGQEPRRPAMIERVRLRRERQREHGVIYRSAFVVAGFTVLLAGLAMLVLPGPALVVIPVGLFMLALEFAWAESLLERALERAAAARRRAQDTSRAQRILTAIAAVLAVAGFVAAAILYDIPVLPV